MPNFSRFFTAEEKLCGMITTGAFPERSNTFSGLSKPVSNSNSESGTSPETLWRHRAASCDDGGTTWFFSRCSRILELRRGIQDASCVGPGKSNLPFELRRKAGEDRKSTRLNSSHHSISYAVFCLKKKKTLDVG